MRAIAIGLFLLLCDWAALFAIVPAYIMEPFGGSDGLPSVDVVCTMQDHAGVMWFGTTSGGLIRYDGCSFQIFKKSSAGPLRLQGNGIRGIAKDKNGRLWVATNHGITLIDPWRLSSDTLPTIPGMAALLQGNVYSVYTDPQGDVWVSLWDVLIRFVAGDANQAVIEDKGHTFRYLNRDKEGNMWLISEENQVFCRRTGQIIHQETKSLRADNLARLLTAYEDLNGWFCGLRCGTDNYQMDPSGTWMKKIAPEAITWSLICTNQDFVKKYKGLAVYDYEESNKYGVRIFKDDAGVSWATINSVGLIKIRPYIFNAGEVPQLRYRETRGMIEDKHGNIYICSYSGIFKYNKQSNNAIKIFDAFKQGRKPIYVDDQRLIMLSEGFGIQCLDLKRLKMDESIFSGVNTKGNFFLSSYQDSEGRIWFGDRQMFYMYPGSLDVHTREEWKKPDLAGINAIYPDDQHTFWVATDKGLYTFREESGWSATAVSLPKGAWNDNPWIRDVFIDKKGRIWLAMQNFGLICWNRADHSVKSYSKQNGFSDGVFQLMPSLGGDLLWAGTLDGLMRIEPATDAVRLFSPFDGLPFNEFNHSSALLTSDSLLLFGGVGGVIIFDPAEPVAAPNRRYPFIPQMVIFNTNKGTSRTLYPVLEKQEIVIKVTEPIFEFSVASSDYLNTDLQRFEYRVLGLHDDWRVCKPAALIRYSNLTGGTYRLQVRLAAVGGSLNTNEIFERPLIVNEFFYKQWPFYFLLVFVVSAIVYALYSFRLRQAYRRQELRLQIAKDLHDGLGGALFSINYLSKKLSSRPLPDPAMKADLEKLSGYSQLANTSINDLIWSIDAKKYMVENLVDRMQDYCDSLAGLQGVDVQFDVQGLNLQTPLEVNTRYELLMIFKEAMTNAIRHSLALRIQVEMKNVDGKFCMRITNQYDALRSDQVSSGRGIPNMQQRARHLNGVLNIYNPPGEFTVELKLNKKL